MTVLQTVSQTPGGGLSPALCDYNEQAATVPTPVRAKKSTRPRNPFNVLTEGLVVKRDRCDNTVIELYLAGVQSWNPGMRRILSGHSDGVAKP
jgi:hypothetical protein